MGNREDHLMGFSLVSAIGVADHIVFEGFVALSRLGVGSCARVASSHLGTNCKSILIRH